MTICRSTGQCGNTMDAPIVRGSRCPDKFGCDPDACPDFVIRRNDSLPPFKVLVEDCDGPLDLEDESIIVEANMWARAKLKTAITADATSFRLADDIGFEQVMTGDIIIMERVRAPEHMLVTGFDEVNKLIYVDRGHNASIPTAWAKGAIMRIFRMINAPASVEMVKQDIVNPDGSTEEDVLTDTFLVYEWNTSNTCLPGCYYLEFKVLKQDEELLGGGVPSTSPSSTPSVSGIPCGATGIEWIRRFPVSGEGFIIQIVDSPTMEP